MRHAHDRVPQFDTLLILCVAVGCLVALGMLALAAALDVI